MAYDIKLADKVRECLARFPDLKIDEKEMFSGVAFIVNDKMCVNVNRQNLMCRFDPALHDDVAERNGFLPMVMKGKELKGYCYVEPIGFTRNNDFEYWIKLCLDYNPRAKSSRKNKQTQ